MKALSIEDLHKSFPGVKAVDGVSFNIEQGDFFGFLEKMLMRNIGKQEVLLDLHHKNIILILILRSKMF